MEYELANISSTSYLPSDSLSTYLPTQRICTCLLRLVANLEKSIMYSYVYQRLGIMSCVTMEFED